MERVRTGQDRVVGPGDRDGSARREGVPARPDTPRPAARRDRTRRALARCIRLIALRSLRSGVPAGLPRRDDVGRCKPGSTPFEAIRNNGKHRPPGARRPRSGDGRGGKPLADRAPGRRMGWHPVSEPGACSPGWARESPGDGEHGGRVDRKGARVREAPITWRGARMPRGAVLPQAGRRGQKPACTRIEAGHAGATIVEEYRV